MCDFEEALRNTLSHAFPKALLLGDSFHVFQNCRKWMIQHGQHHLANEVIATIRILWASKTFFDFNTNLEYFKNRWNNTYAPFMTYFDKTWIHSYPPSQWAFYGRGDNY